MGPSGTVSNGRTNVLLAQPLSSPLQDHLLVLNCGEVPVPGQCKPSHECRLLAARGAGAVYTVGFVGAPVNVVITPPRYEASVRAARNSLTSR